MAERRPDRTLGPGHDAFWAGCAAGELRIQRCGRCALYTWPVAQSCAHCSSPQLAFETVSGRATLFSGCTFERAYYGALMPVPYDAILVELEEGPLFVSNPVGAAWRDLRIGEPMQLAFLDCEDSHGPFRLPVFARAGP